MKKLLPLLKEILGVILFIIWILFFGFSTVFFQENQSCIPVPIVIFSLVIFGYEYRPTPCIFFGLFSILSIV
jgi:hypothetical protein